MPGLTLFRRRGIAPASAGRPASGQKEGPAVPRLPAPALPHHAPGWPLFQFQPAHRACRDGCRGTTAGSVPIVPAGSRGGR